MCVCVCGGGGGAGGGGGDFFLKGPPFNVPIRRTAHCISCLQMTRMKACSGTEIPVPTPRIDPGTSSSSPSLF